MASTQTSLHNFFKTKKTARIGHSIKNAKKVEGIERLQVPAKTVEEEGEEEEVVSATPPVTPKRKRSVEEEVKRKRRRNNEHESEDVKTPDAPKDIKPPLQPAPRSAKKKLIMGAREGKVQQEGNGIQGVKDPGSSPSKQLKKSVTKLTPSEVRERLGRCGRLDELRARLLRVNQCGEKIKQFRERATSSDLRSVPPPSPVKCPASPQIKKFSSLDVEVPISPRKTPVKTPSKTPVKAPDYQRLQQLAQKPSDELVLPFKYRVVKEAFRAMDTVVSLLHNRHEVITYSKLKPAIQEMLRRTFTESHIGQIKTVFPLAYFFKREVIKSKNPSGPNSSHQLTVTANLEYKITVAQNLASMFDGLAEPSTTKYRKMDSILMVQRRNIFHNLLVNTIKDHHEAYLQSLDPPITGSSMSIKRWHPDFPLEEVPDIESAPLPQPPVVQFSTAKDLLEKAHSLFSVNPRMERAVAEAAACSSVKSQPEQSPAPVTPQNTNLATALKGVSNSLLEKIRAREAAKTAREMTRTSGENKELEMLSRLPEIVRIIRNTFVIEKKAALPWDVVATKVAASCTSMLAGSDVDQHLDLLIKEVPGWCVVHKVRSGIFLKINKTVQVTTVTDKLEAVVKQRR